MNDHSSEAAGSVPAREPDMVRLAEELVASADARGIELTGENGLLTALTKQVLQTALEAEMAHHLGYDKHDPAGRNSENSRNGYGSKTVTTEIGQVRIDVPRDRDGTFEPQLVPKRKRRLAGFDEAVVSLYARGMTTGDIAAHLEEVYDTSVSRDLVSTVTNKVTDEMRAWLSRPLDSVYPVILIDAIYLKVRSGTVSNRPVYVAMGVNLEGQREVLGLWFGPAGGEGAKQWMNMLTDLKNRGVLDVCIVCCDGLKGLPMAINAIWPQAVDQTCVVHLVRASLRYSSTKHWQKITPQLRRIYTAATADEARDCFEDFAEQWAHLYPAMVNIWRTSWDEFTPFLAFPPEIRRMIYTTNAIESLNARFRAAIRRREHFPDEQSALKVLYLAATQREKGYRSDRANPTGRINDWKNILNVLLLTYGDRLYVNQ